MQSAWNTIKIVADKASKKSKDVVMGSSKGPNKEQGNGPSSNHTLTKSHPAKITVSTHTIPNATKRGFKMMTDGICDIGSMIGGAIGSMKFWELPTADNFTVFVKLANEFLENPELVKQNFIFRNDHPLTRAIKKYSRKYTDEKGKLSCPDWQTFTEKNENEKVCDNISYEKYWNNYVENSLEHNYFLTSLFKVMKYVDKFHNYNNVTIDSLAIIFTPNLFLDPDFDSLDEISIEDQLKLHSAIATERAKFLAELFKWWDKNISV